MAQGCGATIYAAGPGTRDHRRLLLRDTATPCASTTAADSSPSTGTASGVRSASRSATPSTAGTPIGAEGNTGRSFGCHLHYEVLQDGVSIDPQPFMAALGLPLK